MYLSSLQKTCIEVRCCRSKLVAAKAWGWQQLFKVTALMTSTTAQHTRVLHDMKRCKQMCPLLMSKGRSDQTVSCYAWMEHDVSVS